MEKQEDLPSDPAEPAPAPQETLLLAPETQPVTHLRPTLPPLSQMKPFKKKFKEVEAEPKRTRKNKAPICEMNYQVVGEDGKSECESDDLFEALAALKKQSPGSKMFRNDGVLLAFTTKHRLPDTPHPVFRKR